MRINAVLERDLTTDRDGSVMDCYGFRSLGLAGDPPADGAQAHQRNVPDDSADEPVTLAVAR
jgi:hypothetical protein